MQGRVTTATGNEVGTETTERQRAVSKRAAALTAQMMELVTTPDVGTAPGSGLEGYRVAGKTGTAQQAGEKCQCYDGSIAVSFAGFAPADKPRFTVYVVVKKPAGAGLVAALPAPSSARSSATSCRSTPCRRPAPSPPLSPPIGVETPYGPIDSLEWCPRRT